MLMRSRPALFRYFGSPWLLLAILSLGLCSCQDSEDGFGRRPYANSEPLDENISHGLEWLRKNQGAYGSWGNHDVGITSLAMLAHLEAGIHLGTNRWLGKECFRDQITQAAFCLLTLLLRLRSTRQAQTLVRSLFVGGRNLHGSIWKMEESAKMTLGFYGTWRRRMLIACRN